MLLTDTPGTPCSLSSDMERVSPMGGSPAPSMDNSDLDDCEYGRLRCLASSQFAPAEARKTNTVDIISKWVR